MLSLRRFTSQVHKLKDKLYCSYSSSALPREKKVKVGKWDINYLKVGTGPHNVLCLPGALGTIWSDFKPQIEGFNRDKFTLVVWDPPGYGKSRPPNKEFTTDFYEKDAQYAFEFMKALKIPKYSLLGWSDGGVVGLIHAAKYPDVTKKLVGFGTNAFMLPNEMELYKKVKDVSKWSAKMRKPMEDVYGDFFPKYWQAWTEAMEAIYNTNEGDVCAKLLKDIQCPTLILYGEKDPMVDPAHTTHLLTNISNSRVHLYPDGKHNIHLRYADDFNKRVQEFLLEP